jgi:predicted RNA-binding Zn ribbon-like protein
MPFTHDTEEALRAAVWLVNSAEDPDTLESLDDETAFLTAHPYTGRIDHDARELAALRALRQPIRHMLLAPRDEMVTHVNTTLAAMPLAPQLVQHTGADWHLHAIDGDRPLADRVRVETAMALIDIIRANEGSRISVCADDSCGALALDLSRNRSKRYCSITCANRNAVAAYRARRAEN